MSDIKYICVFGASNSAIPKEHIEFAEELGAALAKNGFALVFGAGTTGLMGAAARGAHREGGEIIGVIPKKLNVPGIYFEHCTERIETPTMHERKALMEEKSDAFIALGGGFGTLEELMEVITLKQLGYMNKEIIIVNIDGFYDNLIAQFDRYVKDGFTHELFLNLYTVVKSVDEVIGTLRQPEQRLMPDKMQEALLSARFGTSDKPDVSLDDCI